MKNKEIEKRLLEKGFVKETLCLHLTEYDKCSEYGATRLSYDLGDTFTADQIQNLLALANVVNNKFLNVKMSFSGTGFIFKEDECK